jgi:RNA polymerase sigma-70 factor (ECF subfamily)
VGDYELDDDDLIQKIAERDLDAFRKLVERHKAFVYTTCCHLIGNHQQAEEASQDVFFQIYRSASAFRHRSKVSTWLYRISVNRSLNVIRRNKRSRWIKSLSGEETAGIPGEEPVDRLERKEMRDIIQTAVDSLPEKQRTAFVLNKYEGLSPKEIAEVLGISTNAVEARLHRAKLNLQKRLSSLLS